MCDYERTLATQRYFPAKDFSCVTRTASVTARNLRPISVFRGWMRPRRPLSEHQEFRHKRNTRFVTISYHMCKLIDMSDSDMCLHKLRFG